jgi:hypothetical protein
MVTRWAGDWALWTVECWAGLLAALKVHCLGLWMAASTVGMSADTRAGQMEKQMDHSMVAVMASQ